MRKRGDSQHDGLSHLHQGMKDRGVIEEVFFRTSRNEADVVSRTVVSPAASVLSNALPDSENVMVRQPSLFQDRGHRQMRVASTYVAGRR